MHLKPCFILFSKIISENSRPCETEGQICQWKCHDLEDTFQCECPEGYSLIGNMCLDENECAEGDNKIVHKKPLKRHVRKFLQNYNNYEFELRVQTSEFCKQMKIILCIFSFSGLDNCGPSELCMNIHGGFVCTEFAHCPDGFDSVRGWVDEFNRVKQGYIII